MDALLALFAQDDAEEAAANAKKKYDDENKKDTTVKASNPYASSKVRHEQRKKEWR